MSEITKTTTYTLEMREDCGGREEVEIDADDAGEARSLISETCADWIGGGEYGDDGAAVSVGWVLLEDGDEIDSGEETVEVEPNYDAHNRGRWRRHGLRPRLDERGRRRTGRKSWRVVNRRDVDDIQVSLQNLRIASDRKYHRQPAQPGRA